MLKFAFRLDVVFLMLLFVFIVAAVFLQGGGGVLDLLFNIGGGLAYYKTSWRGEGRDQKMGKFVLRN